VNYLALLLSFALLSGCRATAVDDDLTLTESYSLTHLTGETVALDFDALPRPLLLVVWQSWCGQCRDECPAVSQLVRTGDGAWDTLGVSVDKRASDAREFVDELHPAYDSVHDPDLAFCDALAVGAAPAFVVVDRSGRVTHRSETADAALARALREAVAR